MTPVLWIIVLWVAFALTHMLPSSARLRPALIERLGTGPYLGLYSLVSLATFVPLVVVWVKNLHGGALLWSLRDLPGLLITALAVSGVAFAVSIASLFQPSPVSVGRPPGSSRGLTRITRHPLFLPFALLGAMHLLLNGYATDVAFFGGLVLYTLIGCAHQDHRKRKNEPELEQYFAETSFLPFGAILTGRNRLALSELPWQGLLIGAAAAWGFYLLHPALFT